LEDLPDVERGWMARRSATRVLGGGTQPLPPRGWFACRWTRAAGRLRDAGLNARALEPNARGRPTSAGQSIPLLAAIVPRALLRPYIVRLRKLGFKVPISALCDTRLSLCDFFAFYKLAPCSACPALFNQQVLSVH
jgi:hypothetical protein